MKTLSIPVDIKTFQHELRIPLTGILGLAELMKDASLSSDMRENLSAITECGHRLLKFIELLTRTVKEIDDEESSNSQNTLNKEQIVNLMALCLLNGDKNERNHK